MVEWTCCDTACTTGWPRLADGGVDALVWSGGVPTPAIAELDAKVPLRMLDIGPLAAPMAQLSGYPFLVRQVPTGDYVPPGLRSIGVPDLLLCRQTSTPTWSPPSWTYSPPTHRNWCRPTSAGCSTSTRRR